MSSHSAFLASHLAIPRHLQSRKLCCPPCSFRSPKLPCTRISDSRFKVRCNSSASNIIEDYEITPIDVTAEVKTERIVVLGGNGFVGSAICKAAVSKGIEVVSVSRSGRPSYSDPWVDQVTWTAGDVLYVRWDEVLCGATAVVSTLGGFGNDEQMKKINGEANIVAVNAAKDFGYLPSISDAKCYTSFKPALP